MVKYLLKYCYLFVTILVIVSGLLLINSYLGDSSIYYIYSMNISQGYFLNYNLNEFSSGATSPLWAIILSLPFLISKNIVIIKIFSIVITLISHIFILKLINSISENRRLNITSYLIISYYTLIYGIMSYETNLLLIVIPLMFYGIIKKKTMITFISLVSLPLIRPDSVLIVIIVLSYLIANKYIKSFKSISILLILFLPSLLYFAFSYFYTGTYSSSSYCRSFALSENANQILGLKYSLSTIFAFIGFPSALLLLLIDKRLNINKINFIPIVSAIGYILVFTLVKPIDVHPHRYLAPVYILLAMSIAFQYRNTSLSKSLRKFFILLILILTILIGLKVYKYSMNGYSFNQVVELDLVKEINEITPPNSLILSYEVQNKYFMRNDLDILSLDGIIDGKVAPYLENSNMISFIKEHKPNYWIANESVNYRKFLLQSKLNEIYNKDQKLKDTIVTENVGFILLKENKNNLGKLANWKKFYKLFYLQPHPQ